MAKEKHLSFHQEVRVRSITLEALKERSAANPKTEACCCQILSSSMIKEQHESQDFLVTIHLIEEQGH